MATGLAIQRSRAEQRLRNVSTAMDRASGYTLGNINATPAAVTLRRGRDHSIGSSSTLGRTPSLREASLTRGGGGARDRHSMMLPVNTETAKYHRQKDLQDIHDNFMKTYKETNKKINDNGVEGEERRSKAYQKIVSNAQPSYMDEQAAKRQTVSEMFMDTNKFSTKTLSAINNLEGAVIRKKQEYNWRKEMEDYEKRSEFERDVRARNVTALNRDTTKENTEEISVAVSSRKRQTDTAREIQIDKAPKQEYHATTTNNNVDRPNKAVESWRKSRENARPQTVAELQPEIEKKSWRERLAEREKEEEERKAKAAAQAPQPSPKVTVPPQEIRPRAVPAAPEASIQPKAEAPKQQQQKQKQIQQQPRAVQQQPPPPQPQPEQQQQTADGQPAVKLSVRAQARAKARAKAAAEAAAAAEQQQTADDPSADQIAGPPSEEAAEGEQEEEDTDGTKKMKKEFDLMMGGLESEMEAGRSKLAKLRERIRKAKASIKDADDALAAEDKSREEEKKQKNS